MIDTHAHLSDSQFNDDLDTVLMRAKDVGVTKIISVSENSTSAARNLILASSHKDFVYVAAGLHPVPNDSCATLGQLSSILDFIRFHYHSIVAVGEVGLDFTPFYLPKDDDVRREAKDMQRHILRCQCELALELGLPVNVHSRSAGDPTIDLLLKSGFGGPNGNGALVQLHAFDGGAKSIRRGIEAGYYFSIPPSSIRSGNDKLIQMVPFDKLLLESDAPSLAPIIKTRNEPCNINLTCCHIAKLKSVRPEDVARITSNNAKKLYSRAFL